MGISKETIKLIYALAKAPHNIEDLDEDTLVDIVCTASDLAEYYEAEEQRRDEKEMRAERRRE
jgi:hypothetical protein